MDSKAGLGGRAGEVTLSFTWLAFRKKASNRRSVIQGKQVKEQDMLAKKQNPKTSRDHKQTSKTEKAYGRTAVAA